MNRNYRLTRSSDIQRVRRSGNSFAHPLLVLIVEFTNTNGIPKTAFLASKNLGGAVTRNRAKRILRGAFEEFHGMVIPGVNLLIIARAAVLDSPFLEIRRAVHQVLSRARIIEENDPTKRSTV